MTYTYKPSIGMYRLLSECSNLFEISFPARYRNETVEAEVYYKQALQLVPTNGIHMHAYVLNLIHASQG